VEQLAALTPVAVVSTLQRVTEEAQAESEEPHAESLRDRVSARGEEALGRIAQDLLDNPWINSALSAAFEARGRAAQAQEAAMEFLNLPSAAHIERLTRRVRSVSQRLEAIEDALTRLEDGLRGAPHLATRLDAIEEQLADVRGLLAELQQAGPDAPVAVSRDQERLRVEEDAKVAGTPPPPAATSAD
jgi:chaperonin cofactor prefoldin